MTEHVKANRRFRVTFGRILLLVLLAVAALQTAYINRLFRENRLRDQQITKQEAEIKELKEKLRIVGAIEEQQKGLTTSEIQQLADVISEESKKYFFDPLLIMALIMTESSFQKYRISDYGAQGLMQLLPTTAEDVARRRGISWLNEFDLYNPALNAKLGIAYLFELVLKFKSLKQGVLAYNMGESTIREYRYYKAEPPSGFYNKVVGNYRMLKSKYGDAVQ
jgi:soluble lytic murein transglycosylase